jgi:methylmalonyl-CoA/ethylmalonyl-CoA epimerase
MEDKDIPEKLVLPEPTHLGYITRDLERTIKNLEKYFGLGSFTKMLPNYYKKVCYGRPEDFQYQLAFSRAGNMVYELIQVIHGKTVYEEFMKAHGEGIHHLGYETQNLAKWIEAYQKDGIETIMSGERVGLKFAYFNTPEIVVELIERTPEGKVV